LTNAELVYVYAVLPRAVEQEVRGIDGRPVRWVVEGDLAAAVTDVPATEFDEAPLNERIRDLRWLEPRAVAHQTVNARLHELSSAVLPLSFGTVFRTDERVRDLLRHEAKSLRERLEGVAGRSEWVLAVHRDEATAVAALEASPRLRDLQIEVQTASPGRAHLLKRRLDEARHDERRHMDSEVEAHLSSALSAVADAVFAEPLPAEAAERPMWRGSLLVERAREPDLLTALDQLRSQLEPRGYRLLLTGPWPPYRFGGLEPQARSTRLQEANAVDPGTGERVYPPGRPPGAGFIRSS
jgi:Gas vesicle synthesis protein GvpL/GvpF